MLPFSAESGNIKKAMYKKKSEIVSVKKFIDELRENRNFRDKDLEFEALRKWPEVAGAHLASHTKPICITDGNLYIRADAAVWCQEMAFRKNEIVKKINDLLGKKAIKDIRYRVEETLDNA